MLRKALCLVVVALVGGMAVGQGKDKDKKKIAGTKAVVVKADVDKRTLEVTIDGKSKTFAITKDVKFYGPRGGKTTKGIRDDRLRPGAQVILVFDETSKALKAVYLPFRKPMRKDKKDKDKDKKDKDKTGKD
jgi:hypothetical protein